MKKTVTFFFALVVMITSFCVSYADVEDEILFRGIPWGTSATEFVTLVQADNLGGSVYDDYTLYSWENGEKKNMDNSVASLKDAGYRYYSYPDATVAGIPIGRIDAYFTFTHDNTQIYRDESDSSLYYAEYSLAPVADSSCPFP